MIICREILWKRENNVSKHTHTLKAFTSTGIELHLPPTPWKCIHVELCFFSSISSYVPNFLRLVFCRCDWKLTATAVIVITIILCWWLYVHSFLELKIQMRPSHQLYVAKRNCHQISSHVFYWMCIFAILEFGLKAFSIDYYECICLYSCLYVSFIDNCWSASNRITINVHERSSVRNISMGLHNSAIITITIVHSNSNNSMKRENRATFPSTST